VGRRGALGALIVASLALAGPAHAAPLVKLHQTGGIAGVDERLVVKRGGAARLTERSHTRRFQVPDKRMQRLRRALGGFANLETSYRSSRPIADGFQYAVTHAGHTVHTEDGADRPKKLDRILAILQRIKSR
jgi:hypothetical protein